MRKIGSTIDLGIQLGAVSGAPYTTLLDVDADGFTSGVGADDESYGAVYTAPALITDLKISLRMRNWSSSGGSTCTGSMAFKVYNTTGSAGSEVPSTLIATSDNTVDVSTLPDTIPATDNVTFTFTGLSISASTVFALAYDVSGVTFPSFAFLQSPRGSDTVANHHQISYNGTSWSAVTAWDFDGLVEYR